MALQKKKRKKGIKKKIFNISMTRQLALDDKAAKFCFVVFQTNKQINKNTSFPDD